jgi:hypothetical protein
MPDDANARRRQCARRRQRQAVSAPFGIASFGIGVVRHRRRSASRRSASASFGIGVVRHRRRSASAPFGICAVRHFAPFGI